MIDSYAMDILDEDEWDGEVFQEIDFSNRTLSDKDFFGCRFMDCRFNNAILRETRFEGCSFEACDLSNPVIDSARFIDTEFERSKLLGIDFYKCNQISFDAVFHDCLIRICNFTDLHIKNAKYKGCEIIECAFQNTFLVKSDFSGSSFKNTLFHNTDLREASFLNATGYAIDPMTNKIEKAVFSAPDVLSLLSFFKIRIQ